MRDHAVLWLITDIVASIKVWKSQDINPKHLERTSPRAPGYFVERPLVGRWHVRLSANLDTLCQSYIALVFPGL